MSLYYQLVEKDEGISPDEHITKELLRQDINSLLESLKPTQREVLILRFG